MIGLFLSLAETPLSSLSLLRGLSSFLLFCILIRPFLGPLSFHFSVSSPSRKAALRQSQPQSDLHFEKNLQQIDVYQSDCGGVSSTHLSFLLWKSTKATSASVTPQKQGDFRSILAGCLPQFDLTESIMSTGNASADAAQDAARERMMQALMLVSHACQSHSALSSASR